MWKSSLRKQDIGTIKFTKETFCNILSQILFQGEIYRSHDPHSRVTETFSNFLEKDDPVETKMVRGSKCLKYIFKKSSRENYLAHKKIKNNCNILIKKQNVNTSKIFINLMLLQDEIYRPHDPHSKLTEIFSKLLKKQPPI